MGENLALFHDFKYVHISAWVDSVSFNILLLFTGW